MIQVNELVIFPEYKIGLATRAMQGSAEIVATELQFGRGHAHHLLERFDEKIN